jgi:hypothetical protein
MVMPLAHRSGNRFCGHLDVSVVNILEKTRSNRYGSGPHGLTRNQVKVISKWNRIKAIRRAPNNGRLRRWQTSVGHVEKPHFGLSVFWLSKWNRVRNVLLEVMLNWSRGWPNIWDSTTLCELTLTNKICISWRHMGDNSFTTYKDRLILPKYGIFKVFGSNHNSSKLSSFSIIKTYI